MSVAEPGGKAATDLTRAGELHRVIKAILLDGARLWTR